MLFLLPLASGALQAWAWRHLCRRVRTGELTKLSAAVRYGSWAFTPLLLFVGSFFGAVGLEEWLEVSLVSEPMGRAALPMAVLLLGIGATGSIAFGARCALAAGLRRGKPRKG